MTTNRQTLQLTKALRSAGVLALIYIVLIFVLPANKYTMHAYHLSALEYRATLFAVMLPSVMAWLAAFFGYARLRQYAYALRQTPEGAHFDKLATGCTWLAWSLPVPAILSLLLSAMTTKWPSFYHSSIIISNYTNLLLPLVAFSIIGTASRELVRAAKLNFSIASVRVVMLSFLTAGVLYCYLTFQRFNLTSLSSTHNPYFLPIWLMVLTVIIPYLYAWFVGLLAAYEIALYSKHTAGVLYRQAFSLLVAGLSTIIISSVALQYMNGINPRVGHLVLGYQLVLSSIFRIIGGGGFVMLAVGSIRLKRIEEV